MKITEFWGSWVIDKAFHSKSVDLRDGERVRNTSKQGVVVEGVLRQHGSTKERGHGDTWTVAWTVNHWVIVTEGFEIIPLAEGDLEYLEEEL